MADILNDSSSAEDQISAFFKGTKHIRLTSLEVH